ALHEVGPQYGGTLSFPYDAGARGLLRNYADFLAGAPDELYVGLDVDTDPKGQRLIELDVSYNGPAPDAERAIAPLRKLGKPHEDSLAAASYVKLQGSDNAPGHARHGIYLRGGFVNGMSAEFIDTVVGCLDGTQLATVDLGFQPTGGAIGRVKPRDTAFWNRAAPCPLHVRGAWRPDAGPHPIDRDKGGA